MRSHSFFMTRLAIVAVTVVGSAIVAPQQSAEAAVTAAQRRELSAIRKSLAKVSSLVRKKQYKESQKIITESETKLEAIIKAAKLTARNPTVSGVKRSIKSRKAILDKAQGKSTGKKTSTAGVSFTKHIAPILQSRCARCHTNNARGGFRIDQPASLQKAITPGKAQTSKIIQRLIATGNQRMPKNGRPLSRVEIQTIALWINQGAKVGGVAGTKKAPGAKPKPAPKIAIATATGTEKVSFKKDIAPFMVNLCLRCHNDRRKSGGLTIATFEKLMQGGKSGRVVLAGNIDGSRMWDLVGKQKPIKMPQGQALITRTNWRNLRTWIEEGAKYDGGDAKKPLGDLVPTEAELKAARFAKFSAQEFAQYRRKEAEAAWAKVLPKEKPNLVESKEFFVIGNVPAARLEEVDKWAEEHATQLRKMFREKASQIFKGKLAIIVMKDRFGYEEFNLIIQKREVPRAMIGHSVVDSVYADAYIVLQNLDSEASSSSPDMKINLIDHLTGAFMKRGGTKLPDWMLRGTGLALASRADPKNIYINALRDKVPQMLKNVPKPEAIFANGTFSPADVGAVGYTLVDFLIRGGGGSKFGQFMGSLHRGSSIAAAAKRVYQTDLKSLAQAYASQLQKKRKR